MLDAVRQRRVTLTIGPESDTCLVAVTVFKIVASTLCVEG